MTNLATEAQWGSGPKIYVSFDYEYSHDASAMKYRFKITVKALPTSGSGYFGYPIYSTITLNNSAVDSGHQLKASTPSQWNSAITYTTSWFTVNNKTSGTTPVSFKIYSGNGSSRSATYSYNLYVSPAISTLSASNGTLGTAQTLTITRYSSSYTHTITYTCGSASGTVCTKSSSTSISFTPPLSLASQNTKGTTVSITFTMTTYSGSTSVGKSTKTITASIPSSVKPTLTLTLSDPNHVKDNYGGKYYQNISKLKVQLNITTAYSSSISTYKIVVDGATYTTNGCTVALPKSKTVNISATITDGRGRTATATTSVTVFAYKQPVVIANAYRCDANGDPVSDGAYIKCVFNAQIQALSNYNSATYKLGYEIKNSGNWQYINLPELDGQYGVSQATVIFAADINYAFQVTVQGKDDFYGPWSTYITVPVAFVLLQAHPDGTGYAIGRRATKSNTVQIGPPLELDTSLKLIGKELKLARALEIGDSTSALPNVPSDTSNGCRWVRIGTSGENMLYLYIDGAGRLYTGTQINGAATITWYQK